MPPPSIRITERLRTTEVPDAALRNLSQLVVEEGGRVTQPAPTTLLVSFGSRWTHRLWGVFGPGARRLPLTLRLEAAPVGSGAVVTVEMTGDEGWYLVRTSKAEDAYRARFADILAALRGTGSGGG